MWLLAVFLRSLAYSSDGPNLGTGFGGVVVSPRSCLLSLGLLVTELCYYRVARVRAWCGCVDWCGLRPVLVGSWLGQFSCLFVLLFPWDGVLLILCHFLF